MRLILTLALILFSTSVNASDQALDQLVYTIRDPETRPATFKGALRKIGEYLALNVLDALSKESCSIETLTGAEAVHQLVTDNPVLVTILRAGLPLNQGAETVFPNAEVGFLVMSRNEETLKAKLDYVSLPDITNRTVIITDTMLATGGSLLDTIKVIEQYQPRKIYVITAIAAEAGIARIKEHNPNIQIFAAAVDPTLNEKGFIVPGLGDAGDRSYGIKYHTLN